MNKLLTLAAMVALTINLSACNDKAEAGFDENGGNISYDYNGNDANSNTNQTQKVDNSNLTQSDVYDNYIDDPFSTNRMDNQAKFPLAPKTTAKFISLPKYGKAKIIDDEIVYNFTAHTSNISLIFSQDTKSLCETLVNLTGDSFSYEVTDELTGTTKVINQEIKFNIDPLLKYQWHVCNYGQESITGYATNIIKGNDLNLIPAWLKGGNGDGVTTYVIDSDFDTAHEDLTDQIQSYQPSAYSDESNVHGTSVIGIIAAKANGKGVRGVSYKTNLHLYAGLTGVSYTFNDVIKAKTSSFNQLVSPVNMSFGSLVPFTRNTFSADNEVMYAANLLPITAASNTYNLKKLTKSSTYAYDIADFYDSTDCLSNGTNCFYPHASDLVRNPNAIIVGATSSDGSRASYSMTGSNLWVSAFGGELVLGSHRILTTDVSGCKSGFSFSNITKYDSDFEKGKVYLNEGCNYTAQMDGTSAATPMVTGAVADLISAKKDLSINQIKYILAKTANNNLPNTKVMEGSLLGWQTNSANVSFSTEFGFGTIDIGAAVDYAVNKCSGDANCAKRKQSPDLDVNVSVKGQNCRETHNEYANVLGQSSYTYECDITMPTEEFSSSSAQIENLGVEFENVLIASDENNPSCSVANTFKNFPKLLIESEESTNLKQQASQNLRDLVVGLSTGTNKEIYLVKAKNENFFGYADDGIPSTDERKYALVNGVYQESMPSNGRVTVYFASECPLVFVDNSISLNVTGYSSL